MYPRGKVADYGYLPNVESLNIQPFEQTLIQEGDNLEVELCVIVTMPYQLGRANLNTYPHDSKLRAGDFGNVYALTGGWNAWIEADYPTEKKT